MSFATAQFFWAKRFGQLPPQLRWHSSSESKYTWAEPLRTLTPASANAWHGTPLIADTIDAEIHAVDDLGRPCLWRTRRGEGAVWLFGFPVEHSPSWTDDEYSARAALLREIFAGADVTLLEEQALGVVGCGDANRRVWMNHSWQPVSVNLPDGAWTSLDGAVVAGTVTLAAKAFDVFTRCTEN